MISPSGRNDKLDGYWEETVGLRWGYCVLASLCDLAPLNLKVSHYGRNDKLWGHCGVTLCQLLYVINWCLGCYLVMTQKTQRGTKDTKR